MKRLLTILIWAGILVSCKKEGQIAEQIVATPQAALATERVTAKEGHGRVQLQCGSQTLIVEGKCGGTTVSGDMIVAVQDDKAPARVFTLTFNSNDYPQSGKTYTIKKSNYMSEGKKPLDQVYAAFSEIDQKNLFDWSSDDTSGTVSFEGNGNEIKCKFAGIKLQPSAFYNKAERNAIGKASGEMTFYKN